MRGFTLSLLAEGLFGRGDSLWPVPVAGWTDHLMSREVTQRQFLNISWGSVRVTALHRTILCSLWLWNKEHKQQKNLHLFSDENSMFGLLENTKWPAIQVLVLAKAIVSRGKSSCFNFITLWLKKRMLKMASNSRAAGLSYACHAKLPLHVIPAIQRANILMGNKESGNLLLRKFKPVCLWRVNQKPGLQQGLHQA